MIKGKMILAAAVLAALAGGYQGFAATVTEPFPTNDVTVTQNTDYITKGQTLRGNINIKGGSSRPDVSISHEDHAETNVYHGVVWLNANHIVNISGLGELNINSDKTDDGMAVGAYISSGGTKFNVTNVDTVNIGTAANPFKGTYGLMTQDGDINIGTEENKVGNVNIYTTESGICGQHNTSDSYGVEINASGNVTIHGNNGAAVQVLALDGIHNSGVSIKADGKVSLEAGKYGAAIEAFDNSGPYTGSGKIHLLISGTEGVDLSSQGDMGVYIDRANAATSDLTIQSTEGDINIKGTSGFYSDAPALVSAHIIGQNVNIHSTQSATINMVRHSNLTLAVNQDGGQITLTTDNPQGNAISVSGDNSRLTLGDGRTATDVNINGYVNVSGTGSKLTFEKNTTTHVDSKYLTNKDKTFITADNADSVTFNDKAKLDIGNVAADTQLNFSNNEEIRKAAADNIVTDNLLQNVTFDKETHQLIVGTVSEEEAAKRLGGSVLTNVALAATGDARYAAVKALVDGKNAKEALDSAGGLSGLANVAHGTYTMNGLFSDAVSGHLMNRQDQDVWAYGFHSKENVNGFSFGGDYDAQYNGVTAGVDLYKNGGTTAGVALTYGDSNMSGSNGFATTKSDSDYYGASIYGRFDRGSYALLGDISYMKGDHDITQWNKNTITASQDSDSISVGVKALKDYAAGENGTLTPYVGLRYLRLSTDDFTANNGLHYVGDDQDMVIVPVGVNYTASISHGKWSVRPYAGIGYVWTAGDRSADQTVMLGGKADSFSYDTADSSSFIARVGVTTDCDDMSYGIGYSWQKGDSVSNNAWTVSASYHF